MHFGLVLMQNKRYHHPYGKEFCEGTEGEGGDDDDNGSRAFRWQMNCVIFPPDGVFPEVKVFCQTGPWCKSIPRKKIPWRREPARWVLVGSRFGPNANWVVRQYNVRMPLILILVGQITIWWFQLLQLSRGFPPFLQRARPDEGGEEDNGVSLELWVTVKIGSNLF